MKDKSQPKTPGARSLTTRPGVPNTPSPLTRLQNSQPHRPTKPTVASTPAKQTGVRPPGLAKANTAGPLRTGLIQQKRASVIQRSKDQRRFTKAWNATQSEDMRGQKTMAKPWRKTVPAKVLIISEGSHRDTGSLHEDVETTVDRTYYPDPDPDSQKEIEKIKDKYKSKALTPWDINKPYPRQEKYDLIIARSSICFCLGNIYACGGYHDERQTLAALKQIASLLNTKNKKARAYLTSGTLVSTAGPKTAPRHLKSVAPFDIRFPEVMPDPQPTFADPNRWDAREDTQKFWSGIPEKFNSENPDFVMLPITMGHVNQDVNEKDPPGWLFGFKIKRLRKEQRK